MANNSSQKYSCPPPPIISLDTLWLDTASIFFLYYFVIIFVNNILHNIIQVTLYISIWNRVHAYVIMLHVDCRRCYVHLSGRWQAPRRPFRLAPAALGPKGRGLLSTLTKIVRTIHNHLYMKIIRSLHFCKFASAHYIKIQRNRKMSIFRFSFGD